MQLAVLNISEAQEDYARQMTEKLRQNGFRVHPDLRNEKITYKIREHSMQKLPYLLIVGDKEVASNLVAVRTRKGEDLGQMPLEALLERLDKELAEMGSTA